MKAACSLKELANGKWIVRHSSSYLGNVEVTGPSRDAALAKMRDELQYRWELCPCSGESLGTVELHVSDDSSTTS